MSACFNIGGDNAKVVPENEERHPDYAVDDAKTGVVNRNRTSTDQLFIILYCVFILGLVVLLAYCMSHGNIYRILNGYDNCGNVYGRLNTFIEIDGTGCRGLDLGSQNLLRVQPFGLDEIEKRTGLVNRICVENCSIYSGYQQILNRCLPDNSDQAPNPYFSKTGFSEFYQEVAEDLHVCWKEMLYMCFTAFAFSLIVLLIFKYLAAVFVWVVLIGMVIICIITTIILWMYYSVENQAYEMDTIGKRRSRMYLTLAIISTIATVILCLVIIYFRKRVELVIALFKEAGKAATDMPLLLFEPVLTFIALSIAITLWFYFSLWIESSGTLTMTNTTSAQFIKDDIMKVTRWYNLMALFWTTQFCIGCQHMIIAGAVSIRYFTRNKIELGSPITRSFCNLVCYHTGTVALGSLLIAILQLLRSLLYFIDYTTKTASNRMTKCCTSMCQCCVAGFQNYLQFINRNAFIESAIYGDKFFVAGRKALHQLMSNSLRVFAINSLGDFVLFMGKAFIVVITVFTGVELLRQKSGIIHHMWIPLTLAGIFAFLIAHCFITVYEMIIDTIFICFCEDCEINNGLERPYFMSSSLMDIVERSKKLLSIVDISENQVASTSPQDASKA